MYNVRASKRSVVNTCRAGSGSLPTPPSRSTQEPVGIGVTCLAPCSSMQLDRGLGEGKFSRASFPFYFSNLFFPPCSLPLELFSHSCAVGQTPWPQLLASLIRPSAAFFVLLHLVSRPLPLPLSCSFSSCSTCKMATRAHGEPIIIKRPFSWRKRDKEGF